jgi:hypothetical protein
MTQEQEYLYENSNVFPNEMSLDVENENTYSDKEDIHKTYKKPFSPSIGMVDEDGIII